MKYLIILVNSCNELELNDCGDLPILFYNIISIDYGFTMSFFTDDDVVMFQ